MTYYSYVGSYDGAVKLAGGWVRVVELNRIDKTGWTRWNGPPSAAIVKATRTQPAMQATDLFPDRAKARNE